MSQKEGIYKLCSLVSGELTDRLKTLITVRKHCSSECGIRWGRRRAKQRLVRLKNDSVHKHTKVA